MADLLAAADVDLVVVVLRGLAVHGVVEVHALGVPSPPVAPHQVSSGTQQADDHCGKDRNCMRLTHSRHTRRGVNTARGHRAAFNDTRAQTAPTQI